MAADQQIAAWRWMTGQRLATLRYMNLTTDLAAGTLRDNTTVTERGIKWASRFLGYQLCQLLDLSPDGPVTSQPPFSDGQPPPNLLLGYYYAIRSLNAYFFDQRTISNLSYRIHMDRSYARRMLWTVLTDSSYSVDTGAFARALHETEDIGNTMAQIQNSILMDRVLSSLNIEPVRGLGLGVGAAAAAPADQQQGNILRGLGPAIQQQSAHRSATLTVRPNFAEGFWESGVGDDEANLLSASLTARLALINYITLCHRTPSPTLLHLPFNGDWLVDFIRYFSGLQLQREPLETDFKKVIQIMTLGRGGGDMRGGALTLRSGTRVGLPFRLRPRERGRAVTASLRRSRGESIQAFIDSLPLRRRRRIQRPAPEEPEEQEEEERGSDQMPGPSRTQPAEPYDSEAEESDFDFEEDGDALDFNNEVITAIAELIEALEQELDENARRGPFFNFGTRLYGLLLEADNADRINREFLLNWLHAFFILEHLNSTLYYLHQRFRTEPMARRTLFMSFVQIVLRGRREDGTEMYSRVWFDRSENPFAQLSQRIVTDFIGIVERAGQAVDLEDPEERDQLLRDMEFVENSGEAGDVINQIQASALATDSVELSFRVKLGGEVAYSQNRRVQRAFRALRLQALRQLGPLA
nr:pTP [Bearded dragon adenovirus 1]